MPEPQLDDILEDTESTTGASHGDESFKPVGDDDDDDDDDDEVQIVKVTRRSAPADISSYNRFPKRQKINSPSPRSELVSRSNSCPTPPSMIRCPECWGFFPETKIDDHYTECTKPPVGLASRNEVAFLSSSASSSTSEHAAVASLPSSVSTPSAVTEKSLRSKRQQQQQLSTFDEFSNDDSDDHQTYNVTRRRSTRRSTPNSTANRDANLDQKPASNGFACYPRWRRAVESTLRRVRRERREARNNTLKQMIIEKNKMLQAPSKQPPTPLQYFRLPGAQYQAMPAPYLEEKEHPLPRDSHHTVFIRKHFSSLADEEKSEEDSEAAQESDQEEDVVSLVDKLSPSKKIYARQIEEFVIPDRIGVGYEEDELDHEIDAVLEYLKSLDYDMDEMQEYLALLLQEDIQRVKKRWEKAKGAGVEKRQYSTKYEQVMSSFRDLFCRRCFVFDCNTHGLAAKDSPPDIQLEYALHLEESGFWKDFTGPPMCFPISRPSQTNQGEEAPVMQVVLTDEQKEIAKRLYKMFRSNVDMVAQAMAIPRAEITRQVTLDPFEFKLTDPALFVNPRLKHSKSGCYHAEWVKRIHEVTSWPFFDPCTHSEPCSEETCSCIQNRFFCTKACIYGASSKNFFRGCNCNSKCTTKSCPCFASNRECDPDLCKKCGACTDPPNKPAIAGQNCRNDNLGMRRHVHLLLGKSRVAGWGLFTKNALEKGEYVHEYLGELVSQNEAERRGKIYDERNQTYIFDMSTDFAVDALRKGNKTRFINHSDTPNIGPLMKVVNGDYRIGFFALKNIPAQTELFFDYGDKFFSATGSFLKKP